MPNLKPLASRNFQIKLYDAAVKTAVGCLWSDHCSVSIQWCRVKMQPHHLLWT